MSGAAIEELMRWQIMRQIKTVEMETIMEMEATTQETVVEGRLPDSIQGSVMASKPKMLQEAIKLARSLMDQKVLVYAARQADNKRRVDNNPRNNHAQQLPYKKHNVARAYIAGFCERKEYAGTLPLCNKCKFRHNGYCVAKCMNCKRVGHLARDYRSPAAANTQRAPRAVQ
nr:reverse transcriptase domain-containing protein [Tanacetum cinerariifolium]